MMPRDSQSVQRFWRSDLKFLTRTAAIVVFLLCCACSGKTPPTSCPTQTCRVIRVASVGRGQACQVNGITGPPSYLANNIGHVAMRNATDRRTLDKIQRFVHPTTLRFAYVGGEFIVFDAVAGPCEGGAPGYPLLNQGCSDYYAPTDFESPDAEGAKAGITGAPGGCRLAPRPWMPGDGGDPKAPSWSKYLNNH
jgi:hypothetical protein